MTDQPPAADPLTGASLPTAPPTPAQAAAEQATLDVPIGTTRKRDWHNVGTRVRTARLSDPLWDAVKAEAERTDSTTSTIVRDALDAYLDRRP